MFIFRAVGTEFLDDTSLFCVAGERRRAVEKAGEKEVATVKRDAPQIMDSIVCLLLF